ncbi:hypothetical protein C5Q97_19040 [Victivallales bacterium CCUG 44730]|nr:hypothetical protein C5Q97_19040 [Victivallales bacterium CCUG 44730]
MCFFAEIQTGAGPGKHFLYLVKQSLTYDSGMFSRINLTGINDLPQISLIAEYIQYRLLAETAVTSLNVLHRIIRRCVHLKNIFYLFCPPRVQIQLIVAFFSAFISAWRVPVRT